MTLLYRTLLFLLLLPTVALAQLPGQLLEDLAPVDGVVLMAMGDSWLVDLDANQNLRPGDILAVMTAGETIIHPQTRDIVGRIDHVAGFLEVTRVLSGYSYAELLTEGLSLQAGDQVRRFEQVPAYMDDSVPASLTQELKRNLNHFKWFDQPLETAETGLIFRLQDERLSVSGRGGVFVGSYRYSEGQVLAPLTPTIRQTEPVAPVDPERSALNRGVDSLLGTVGLTRGDTRLEAPGVARHQQSDGIWISPPLGENPVGLASGDLTGDGRTEVAVALENELRIMRMEDGRFVAAGVVNFPAGTRLLAIDAHDLDGNGRAELYLTAVIDSDLRSQVVEYRNGRFERVITMVNWFMRVVDLPGEGPVLLGQRLSRSDEPFAPPVFRIARNRDRLVRGEALDLPARINLFSMLPVTAASGETIYVSLSADDRLQLVNGSNDRLWRSSDYFGGSDTSFYHRPGSEATNRVPVAIQQRLGRLAAGDLLTVQNQGSRLLKGLRTFTDAQLVAFEWDASSRQLLERWRTPAQKGYIADFIVADLDDNGELELLIAMRFQEKNILQRGHSALMVFTLQQ
ncbi:FG-GAP-like repeat-containing protein [Pelovirga terrestris]|uniref:VCBS repeat-containing protein n=1 Tax=Pelovirga terrestris TaxID=2771352 RepID=A0A8J6QYW6_9BACT|nr:FG-GAP-like repeat-containing protein [Pelovirga terrestris]MBD1401598.1 VCBS repeat-containing protein [Pelovirga terrestris]